MAGLFHEKIECLISAQFYEEVKFCELISSSSKNREILLKSAI